MDARATQNAFRLEMQGKASNGQQFDILATDVILTDVGLGETTNSDLFLGPAQYSDRQNGGASDQKLTMTPHKAVFSGAKFTSLSGSNITVTGTMVC